MNKVIFIDRDGTINVDEKGYISKPEQFNLFPFAIEAIKGFRKLGYKVVVVTNQSGIARGYYTFADLEKVHQRFKDLLSEADTYVDAILVAPYHPEGVVEPYNVVHEDRKPSIGLLKKYFSECNFKTSESFMIGDKLSDIEFGVNYNLKTILVLTGNGINTFKKGFNPDTKPDYVLDNLLSVVELLKKIKYKGE